MAVYWITVVAQKKSRVLSSSSDTSEDDDGMAERILELFQKFDINSATVQYIQLQFHINRITFKLN